MIFSCTTDLRDSPENFALWFSFLVLKNVDVIKLNLLQVTILHTSSFTVRRDSWHAQQSNLQKVSKPFKRRRGLFDDDGQEEDGLPWRIYPREYHDDMSRLLYKTWMHGYQDGTEEEFNDGVEYSQSQVCTATRWHFSVAKGRFSVWSRGELSLVKRHTCISYMWFWKRSVFNPSSLNLGNFTVGYVSSRMDIHMYHSGFSAMSQKRNHVFKDTGHYW